MSVRTVVSVASTLNDSLRQRQPRPRLLLPSVPDDLFCFCGSMYGSPLSSLFLALSGDSSDEEEEEDEEEDDEGGGDDDFSCVQFGSRYHRMESYLHVLQVLRD